MKTTNLVLDRVLPNFFVTLLISFVGMIVGMLFIPKGIAILASLSVLVILIVVAFKRRKDRKSSEYGMRMSMWLVHVLTFLMGIGVYPAIERYLSSMGATWVLAAFGITTALFGSLFLYAFITKKDFSFLGGILFFSLVALILVSIVGIFFIQSPIFHLALAWVGVMIFSGYMLYDVSRMKKASFTEEDVPGAVLDLFLNFINLFLDILRIVNFFVNRD